MDAGDVVGHRVRQVPADSGEAASDVAQEDAEDWGCAVCGRPRSTVMPLERWLEVEIYRRNDDDILEQGEGFCSQEHAAEWLLRPLPPVIQGRPAQQWGWRDRLTGAAVASAVGLCAAACLLGVVTVVRWLVALLT